MQQNLVFEIDVSFVSYKVSHVPDPENPPELESAFSSHLVACTCIDSCKYTSVDQSEGFFDPGEYKIRNN